jgi:hypothetical protein
MLRRHGLAPYFDTRRGWPDRARPSGLGVPALITRKIRPIGVNKCAAAPGGSAFQVAFPLIFN